MKETYKERQRDKKKRRWLVYDDRTQDTQLVTFDGTIDGYQIVLLDAIRRSSSFQTLFVIIVP